MTDQNKSTDERNVDRHDATGMAGWLRERATTNREVAKLPRDQWPHRPDVLLHWALRFDQGAVLVERLELERLQAVHERDCAVEDVKRILTVVGNYVRTKKADMGESVVHWMDLQEIAKHLDVPAPHDPKCKPDFPFHLCPVCYPGL